MYECLMSLFKLPDPPRGWKEEAIYKYKGHPIGRVWKHGLMPLTVIRSMVTFECEDEWIHLAIARAGELPSWLDLMKCKDDFLGEFREGYHCLPKSDERQQVDVCVHLWSPINMEVQLPNVMKLTNEKPL